MRATRPLLPLCVMTLLCASSLLPPGARTQEARADAQGGRAARQYALVVGNNEYRNVPPLKTAVNDARAVEAILREQYGFQTRLLLNATRQQIINALNSYRRELDAESSLLIYYAGHGVNDKEIDRAYWLPVDAERDDNANWISADDITSNIKGIPARHVLIVSDSCYSGTLTRGLEVASSIPAVRERYLQKMAAGRSRTLMASGGNEPVADAGGAGNHSVFAGALLRGLQETEKPQFTAAELYREYVEEAVAGRASQTPEYNPLRNSGHENGDFVFVRVKTPDGKTVEVTVKTAPAGPVDPAAVELSFWETIKGSTDPEDFKAYLQQYPSGQFAALAKNRIAGLGAPVKPEVGPTATPSESHNPSTEFAFWDAVKGSTSADDFNAYLKKYPNGEFAELAKIRVANLETAAREREKAENARRAAEETTRLTKSFKVALFAGTKGLWAKAMHDGELTVSPGKVEFNSPAEPKYNFSLPCAEVADAYVTRYKTTFNLKTNSDSKKEFTHPEDVKEKEGRVLMQMVVQAIRETCQLPAKKQ